MLIPTNFFFFFWEDTGNPKHFNYISHSTQIGQDAKSAFRISIWTLKFFIIFFQVHIIWAMPFIALDGTGRWVLTQSDIMTSSFTLLCWLVHFHISSQWARCSTFKYLASACCGSCNALQNPPPPQLHLYRFAAGWLYVCYSIWELYLHPLYFLHAHISMFVNVLAAASLRTCFFTRTNTLTLSCILPCWTLQELSLQNLESPERWKINNCIFLSITFT